MKRILIFTALFFVSLTCSKLLASDYLPGAKLSSKIEDLQKKVTECHNQVERLDLICKEHGVDDENQLYTLLLSEQEAAESDVELCRLGSCHFKLEILQYQNWIKDLEALKNNKYSNQANITSLEEEKKDLRAIKNKYIARDYSDHF